jgi:hypothetical protein
LSDILGIISHSGVYGHELFVEMEQILERIFTRAEAYAHKNGEVEPETDIGHIYHDGTIPLLAPQVGAAKSVIFIAHAKAIEPLWGFCATTERTLAALGGEGLRGKWVGLVVYDEQGTTSLGTGLAAQSFLMECNMAGMLLLPQACVYVSSLQGREHVRLGTDLAEMLTSQREWTGHPVRSKAA